MAMSTAELKTRFAKHRLQGEVIGVSLLAVVVAITLGVMARRQAAPLNVEHDRLVAASREIEAFRGAFQPATPEEESYRLPDTLVVGVARDVRFTLAQQISQRAEQAGLRDVRVRFAPADTAVAPKLPEMPGSQVTVADYTITVECHGDMSAVLSALRNLPPSVAFQSMIAVRNGRGSVDYHLTLAVFETPAEPAHG